MKDRLRPIDWKSIVTSGKEWDDSDFRYSEEVLFDWIWNGLRTMMTGLITSGDDR
jgi:hypothetical protein